MALETIRSFFMWCSILNVALLTLSFLICAFAADWVYQIHSKWFPIPRETFNVVLYSFIGLYKMFLWVFNLIPYIALTIIK